MQFTLYKLPHSPLTPVPVAACCVNEILTEILLSRSQMKQLKTVYLIKTNSFEYNFIAKVHTPKREKKEGKTIYMKIFGVTKNTLKYTHECAYTVQVMESKFKPNNKSPIYSIDKVAKVLCTINFIELKVHSLSTCKKGRQMNIMRPRKQKKIRPINYIIVFKLNPQFNVNDVNAITQIHRTFAIFIFHFLIHM